MAIPEASVDWDKLLETADADASFLRELVDVFALSCTETLDKIRSAHQDSNWVGIQRAAHALKGACANMRAPAAAIAAATLESDASAEDRSRLSSHIDKLEAEIQAAVIYINIRLAR